MLPGVDDDAQVYGVTLRPGYEEWVADVGAQTIDPPPIDPMQQLLNWKILIEQNGEHKVTLLVL